MQFWDIPWTLEYASSNRYFIYTVVVEVPTNETIVNDLIWNITAVSSILTVYPEFIVLYSAKLTVINIQNSLVLVNDSKLTFLAIVNIVSSIFTESFTFLISWEAS